MDTTGPHGLVPWTALLVALTACLALDFGLAAGRHRAIGLKEAVGWNVFWVAVALAVALPVHALYGATGAAEYLTGYVVERSLSVDNIFVFVVIFKYFAIPDDRQARVLFLGIIGALLMRAVFIVAGAAIASRFHAILYLFGAFLVYTGIALVVKGEQPPPDPDKNLVVRAVGRVLPILRSDRSERLFVRTGGRFYGTPMLVALLVVASTDFVFALDSLPAILGVTRNPWILFASNAFAVLGMRVLYFLLAAVLPRFRYLNYGLALILTFIGARMLVEPWLDIPIGVTLGLVLAILAVSIAASLVGPGRRGGDQGL